MDKQNAPYSADGLAMAGELYRAGSAQGKKPGILVFPEAFGLGVHARDCAQRLAELGYVALACDLHGGGKELALPDAMPVIMELRENPQRIRARAQAALDVLKSQADVDATRIAAIGFCFGGTMALELARSGAAIKGVVGFHSGLGTAAPLTDAQNIKAKVLVLLGADDPLISAEERATFEGEMRGGKVDWRMHLYGGVVHSFTNPEAGKVGMPEALAYDAAADKRSWSEMQAFFKEIF